jgi:hypothetical protein
VCYRQLKQTRGKPIPGQWPERGSPSRSRPVFNSEKEMQRVVSLAVLWAAFAMPAVACDKPTAPDSIPDGKSAAMEEMMAAKKAVDAYKSAMEEYLSCEKSNAKLDAAQAELLKVADRFNTQVRAFKAKS